MSAIFDSNMAAILGDSMNISKNMVGIRGIVTSFTGMVNLMEPLKVQS
jgi:hypothetical protein